MCAGPLLMVAPGARDFVFPKRFGRRSWSLLVQNFAPFAILNGAFMGALSHVVLDGFMYPELNKPWLNLIDVSALHLYFFLAIIAGLFWAVIG